MVPSVNITVQRTLDGFTWEPGTHAVDEETAARLLERFPAVVSLTVLTPVPLPPQEEAPAEAPIPEEASAEAGLRPESAEVPEATEAAVAMATEAGLDLALVNGSGTGGKITKADVELALKQIAALSVGDGEDATS